MSLRRLGWTWPTAFTFLDDRGLERHLVRQSPADLQAHLRAASRRSLEKKLADNIRGDKANWRTLDGRAVGEKVSVGPALTALRAKKTPSTRRGGVASKQRPQERCGHKTDCTGQGMRSAPSALFAAWSPTRPSTAGGDAASPPQPARSSSPRRSAVWRRAPTSRASPSPGPWWSTPTTSSGRPRSPSRR